MNRPNYKVYFLLAYSISSITVGPTDWTLHEDAVINGPLNLRGSTLNLNGHRLTVHGGLTHSGGTLLVNGGNLVIEGDYRIQNATTNGYSSGVLKMTNPADYVLVKGSFVMDSAYRHDGYLTAGTLEVRGNFTQKSTYGSGSPYGYPDYNFSASGTHKVRLSGTAQQTVRFEDPSTSYSHFNILENANVSADGVNFATAVVVTLSWRNLLLIEKIGSGTLVSSPSGIDFGTDSQEFFTKYTIVNFSTTPAQGYLSVQWSSLYPGVTNPPFTMNRAMRITATFKRNSNPLWWYGRGVLLTNQAPNDYAIANLGQIKWVAKKAMDELNAKLPGGAGSNITTMVNGFVKSNNYYAANLGQLKYVAKPFYDRLWALGLTNAYPLGSGTNKYPWQSSTNPARDYSPANIGQLKHLFSFEVE